MTIPTPLPKVEIPLTLELPLKVEALPLRVIASLRALALPFTLPVHIEHTELFSIDIIRTWVTFLIFLVKPTLS
jgi:hypothetical protein